MPEGSFEPTIMFFRLTNSPATFQAMMNDLLRDLVVEEKVVVFIDDMIVAMETEEGHNEIVEEVLRRLEENDLFVKLEKYVWKVRDVGFLGVIIGEDGVRMEKKKVQGVIEWPVPRSIKDVQKFLRLANYYRRFVKDFARIAKPLCYGMLRILIFFFFFYLFFLISYFFSFEFLFLFFSFGQ